MKTESDELMGTERHLSLRVVPPAEAIEGQITVAAPAALGKVVVDGKRLAGASEPNRPVLIDFYGWHDQGISLQVTAETMPVTVTVQSHLMGLPQVPGMTVIPRPASMMTAPFNSAGDASLVAQTWVIR